MFRGARLTAWRGGRGGPAAAIAVPSARAPLVEWTPVSGMHALPGHLVCRETRPIPADALIPLARHHHTAEADAHGAAHVLLHRELDRLARAHRPGHAEALRTGEAGHRFEHRRWAAGVDGIRPI